MVLFVILVALLLVAAGYGLTKARATGSVAVDYPLMRLAATEDAPAEEPHESGWPGYAHEYQIVRYRDAGFKIIEARIKVKSLHLLSRAIREEKYAGRAGILIRTVNTNYREISRWTGLSQST